jgi:uncharacterized protein YjbI with pentapeptide repeats
LRGSRLNQAALRGANLRGSILHQANLSRADLREADLTAADVHGVSLTGALYNASTRWDEEIDFNPQAAGAVKKKWWIF